MKVTVNEGKKVMGELRNEFETLANTTKSAELNIQKSFDEIRELLKFFNEIENKTKVINEIVFQTKLLSFNASVEAARAGEHGKGFAVVAEEVGKLAQLSGNAAAEINSLLSSGNERSQGILNSAISRAESTFQGMTQKVTDNGTQTERCLKSFEQIASNLDIATDRLSQIAKANEEQKTGVESLTRTFAQVAQVAQEITHHVLSSSTEGRKRAQASLDLLTSNLAKMLDTEDKQSSSVMALSNDEAASSEGSTKKRAA